MERKIGSLDLISGSIFFNGVILGIFYGLGIKSTFNSVSRIFLDYVCKNITNNSFFGSCANYYALLAIPLTLISIYITSYFIKEEKIEKTHAEFLHFLGAIISSFLIIIFF